jgi:MFS family permease
MIASHRASDPALRPARGFPVVRVALAVALALALQGGGALLIALSATEWLVIAFGIAGIGTGLVDVFVNAAGQSLESRTARPVLQTVHACYGVGGALGALSAGAVLSLGGTFRTVLVIAVVVQVGVALGCTRTRSLAAAEGASGAAEQRDTAPSHGRAALGADGERRVLLTQRGRLLADAVVRTLTD